MRAHATSTQAGKLIASLLVPMRDQSALGGPQGPRVRIRTQCKGRGDGVCWSDKPVSHASWRLGPNHTPRRRRAAPRGKPRHNSQRRGLCGRKAWGRHGACALSLTVPVHKGPLTLDGRLPQPSHLPLRRRRRTGEAQRSQVAARPFKTCSGCIRAFESEFGTTDTLSQTALQWGVLHPRGAELRLCLCSLGARNPPQAVTSQLSLDFARCDKDSHPGGRRRSP